MGKRGPQPQPAELKKLRGNPGKRAIPKTASSVPMVHECPKDLEGIKPTWNHYGEVLRKMGILQDSDGITWEILWRMWKEYLDLCKDDEASLSAKVNLVNTIVRLLDHFGMSPSSRGTISVDLPKEESEFEKFMKRDKKATG